MSSALKIQPEISPKIIICVDEVGAGPFEHHDMFKQWEWEVLRSKLLKAGVSPETSKFVKLSNLQAVVPPADDKSRIDAVIVGLGERVLNELTGLRSIDKWQSSPLRTRSGQAFIPAYGFDRIIADWSLGFYLELALRKAKNATEYYNLPSECFKLNPPLEETLVLLNQLENEKILSVDLETGRGQINTVGFAWSPTDAVAINVLPNRLNAENHYKLWSAINRVLEGKSDKVFQNFIYDCSYFSAYGIRVNNIYHDTMWAQKILYPEFKANLGNVGRIYTKKTYWKDDGKVNDGEESAKKDWGDIRDWDRHYLYNCRDTSGDFEGFLNQEEDLKERGLTPFFRDYVMKLVPLVNEMCSRGMPLSLEVRDKLRKECETKAHELITKLHTETGTHLNPGSPKQLKEWLVSQKIKLPMKYNKSKGESAESTDASSLKKIRLKYPKLTALQTIADIKELNTHLSRYIKFQTRPGEAKLRYSLNAAGTETLRMSGHQDAWDNGFNIQTIPREGGPISIKSMFVAPEGWSFLECDLRQAESRFVAYDSGDKTLIDMLESGEDVHKYVAHEILRGLGKPATDYSKEWRQLGKKSGHGANYAMKAGVFVETVFHEMDLVLTKQEAQVILDSYYKLFPGIPMWHNWIKKELAEKRKLTAPSGWNRYFYGRYNDDMFKEAFAWRPQHTIPWITNTLMLHLAKKRGAGELNYHQLIQIHDSLVLLVPTASIPSLAKACLNTPEWHPKVDLLGGRMVIPVECKAGPAMDRLEEVV